jgi:hypothetical protein
MFRRGRGRRHSKRSPPACYDRRFMRCSKIVLALAVVLVPVATASAGAGPSGLAV